MTNENVYSSNIYFIQILHLQYTTNHVFNQVFLHFLHIFKFILACFYKKSVQSEAVTKFLPFIIAARVLLEKLGKILNLNSGEIFKFLKNVEKNITYYLI